MLNKPFSFFKSLCCPAGKESAAARPRQRRKEARPTELLAAALELFVERGFAATRLDDVAARAGVTKGTLYLYFDNKEALFKTVVETALVPLVDEAVRHAEQYQGSMAELLKELMLGWWERVGSTALSGIPKLIVSEAGNFPEATAYYHKVVIEPWQRLLRSILTTGVERGEFRPIDVESALHVVMAPLLMLMIWRHSFALCGRGVDPDRYLATNLDLTLKGLCNPVGSST